jgi:hypothetical protein
MIRTILIITIIILSLSIPSTASIRSDENAGRLLPILDSNMLQRWENLDRLMKELKKRLKHLMPIKSFLPLDDEEGR